MSEHWADSKTNLPPHLEVGSDDQLVGSPYEYDNEKINNISYTYGKEVAASSYISNFFNASYDGELGTFGTTNMAKPTGVDVFGVLLDPSKIYIDFRRSKYAKSEFHESCEYSQDLEDRWAIDTGSGSILGVTNTISDGNENWKTLVKRAIIYDPEIENSGNCYICVNDLGLVASRLNGFGYDDGIPAKDI
jgi:hypothetical protein